MRHWKAGRKPTGLKRNKRINFYVTEEEREFIKSKIQGKSITDFILELIKKNS